MSEDERTSREVSGRDDGSRTNPNGHCTFANTYELEVWNDLER